LVPVSLGNFVGSSILISLAQFYVEFPKAQLATKYQIVVVDGMQNGRKIAKVATVTKRESAGAANATQPASTGSTSTTSTVELTSQALRSPNFSMVQPNPIASADTKNTTISSSSAVMRSCHQDSEDTQDSKVNDSSSKAIRYQTSQLSSANNNKVKGISSSNNQNNDSDDPGCNFDTLMVDDEDLDSNARLAITAARLQSLYDQRQQNQQNRTLNDNDPSTETVSGDEINMAATLSTVKLQDRPTSEFSSVSPVYFSENDNKSAPDSN